MQFALTSEHTMIVDTVRAFVEKELYPHEDLVERTDAIPPELVQSIQAKARGGFVRGQYARRVGRRRAGQFHGGAARARAGARLLWLANAGGAAE